MDEREACDLQEQPVFEQPQDETAPQQTEDEPSDDPVMPKGQVGKLLLLCLLACGSGRRRSGTVVLSLDGVFCRITLTVFQTISKSRRVRFRYRFWLSGTEPCFGCF